jgi:hypothetical protein
MTGYASIASRLFAFAIADPLSGLINEAHHFRSPNLGQKQTISMGVSLLV